MLTVRFLLPLLLLIGVFSVCGAPPPGATTSPTPSATAAMGRFVCKRKGFTIFYAPPAGWGGPVYAGGAALDSWTLSHGPSNAPDALETRIYDAKDSLIRWDKASEQEILAEFQGTYLEPRVERIDTVTLDGHEAAVYAIHSVGVEEYLANVYHGDSLVSIMCTSYTPEGLTKQRAAFLAFLRSLRFEKTP